MKFAALILVGITVTVRVQVTFVEPGIVQTGEPQTTTYPANCYSQGRDVICR